MILQSGLGPAHRNKIAAPKSGWKDKKSKPIESEAVERSIYERH